MMELKEAIIHARQVAEGCPGGNRDCAYQHDKLVDWLEELQRYKDLEAQGRLVVLDEPRKPLIWGDDTHETILCSNCERDLMGGFELADSSEITMIQCPHCGQLIDGTKAFTREETEQALKKGVGHG